MTKAEAQSAYRAAWRQRCLAATRDEQRTAERAMDSVQGMCVDGGLPGPEWETFVDTLPGYRDHWSKIKSESEAMIERIFGGPK